MRHCLGACDSSGTSRIGSSATSVCLPFSAVCVDLPTVYPSVHLFSMMIGRFDLSSIAGKLRKEGLMIGNAGMQQFRILEHTADVGFEAFGLTREEAFVNAARALIYLIVELDAIDPREEVSVQVQGADPESLLVNWLSELLYSARRRRVALPGFRNPESSGQFAERPGAGRKVPAVAASGQTAGQGHYLSSTRAGKNPTGLASASLCGYLTIIGS